MPPPLHESTLRIYYEDTDAGGIVYHANYLRYFERVRTDWLRSLGAVHTELAQREDLMFVVRDMTLDFRAPARLDDLISVDVRVTRARRASLQLMQIARHAASGATLVVAELRVAAIQRSGGKPLGLPSWLFEKVRG